MSQNWPLFKLILASFMLFRLSPLFATPESLQSVSENSASIAVDKVASSSREARAQAVVEAQRQALISVLNRAEGSDFTQRVISYQDSDIEDFVQDTEFLQEKSAANRFIGLIKVTFKSKALKSLRKKVSPVEATPLSAALQKDSAADADGEGTNVNTTPPTPLQKLNVLLLPIYKIKERMLLWEEENHWLDFWNRSKTLPKNIHIPIGDLEDLQELSIKDMDTPLDAHKIHQALQRHTSEILVMALLEQDSMTASPHTVGIHAFHPDGREFATVHMSVSPQDSLKNAFTKVQAFLSQLKVPPAPLSPSQLPHSASDDSLSVHVLKVQTLFDSPHEWREISSRLESIKIIHQLQIEQLGYREATISFSTKEALPSLQMQMLSLGLILKLHSDQLTLTVQKNGRSASQEKQE